MTSNSSPSTRPVGWVLWEELLDEGILHITPLLSLMHTLLKDKCICLQDKWKLKVTRPAGQVQYWNIFVPWYCLQNSVMWNTGLNFGKHQFEKITQCSGTICLVSVQYYPKTIINDPKFWKLQVPYFYECHLLDYYSRFQPFQNIM